MSSLLCHSLRLPITRAIIISRPTVLTTSLSTPAPPPSPLTRAYASKKPKTKQQQKHEGSRNPDAESESPQSSSSSSPSPGSKRAPVSTASLTPGSQQALTDPAARDECARADARMATCVEWFRREVARLEARASGRVTPRLLDPVRVSGVAPLSASLASSSSSSSSGQGAGAKKVQLEEVATVGVRDGSTLIVTVFDPQNLKHVQDALYEAKIRGVIPQRVDDHTLRIPIPKPTVEARLAAYSTASKQAEETRVQIRRHHQASVKKGKYARHSIAYDEFQKLQDRHIADVDSVLAQLRRSSGAR